MKQLSPRAQRMQRHYERSKRTLGLNLISMMDIFTILVFFLLVNSSDVIISSSTATLRLPESTAEQKRRETIVVTVTQKEILVQGNEVVSVDWVQAVSKNEIEPLKAALEQQADRKLRAAADFPMAQREVTIMGDKAIPFSLLKKIMVTCTRAGYHRISLSVIQIAARKS